MTTFLLFVMILSGVVTTGSIMLMTPKGGLGVIGGMMSGSNEYGSKKSLETTLKTVAIVAGVIFIVTCIVYPYIKN